MGSRPGKEEPDLTRRTVLGAAGASAAGIGIAAIVASTDSSASAWMTPTIRAAVGAPAAAASEPDYKLNVSIVSGECEASGWRRADVFVSYKDTGLPVEGALVGGYAGTRPHWDEIEWYSNKQYSNRGAVTNSAGITSVFCVVAGTPTQEIDYLELFASKNPVGGGHIALSYEQLPPWMNNPV